MSEKLNTFGARLRETIDAKGLKWTKVAKACGISPSTFDGYLKSTIPPADKASAIAEYLGVDLQWLTTGIMLSLTAESRENPFWVRIYDQRLSAGGGAEILEQLARYKIPIPNYVFQKMGKTSADNFGVFTVSGDSMEPSAPDGSMALVDMSYTDIKGSVYAFSVGDEARIKRLRKKITGEIEIISDNPLYQNEVVSGEELNLIKVIGKVVWLGRWL